MPSYSDQAITETLTIHWAMTFGEILPLSASPKLQPWDEEVVMRSGGEGGAMSAQCVAASYIPLVALLSLPQEVGCCHSGLPPCVCRVEIQTLKLWTF